MAAADLFWEKTTIGKCLMESLDEMVTKGTLKPEHALQVVLQFYKSMTKAVKMHATQRISIKGHLDWYRFSDDRWTFVLSDALIKTPISEKNTIEKENYVKRTLAKSK